VEKIRVQGFQSLADVTIELGAFTAVEGDSRAGKSALVRALKVWAYNAKSVGAFVRHGEDQFTVTVDVAGHEVICRRGEGVTQYELDGTLFEKVGFTVPEAVSDVTGFRAVRYDKDLVLPLQVQGQFDAPFLLGEQWTGPSITKVLGSVSQIGVIYVAQRACKKRQRTTQRTIGEAKERATELKADLAKYDDVDERLERLTVADGLWGDAVDFGLREDELARAQEWQEEAQEAADSLAAPTSRPTAAWRHAKAARSELARWEKLDELTDAWASAQDTSESIDVPTARPAEARERVEVLRAELDVLRQVEEIWAAFGKSMRQIKASVIALGMAKQALADANEAKAAFFNELGACPFCGQVTRGRV